MNIVFAHPRYVYQSYVDYRRLAELSGFESCFVDQIDFQREAFYIVTPINGEFRPHVQNHPGPRKCRIAWWNLERPDSGPGVPAALVGSEVANVTGDLLQFVDYVWCSDWYMCDMDQRQVYVVCGSHSGLAEGPRRTMWDWDLCHLSYMSGRRQSVMAGLQDARLTIAGSAWGPERDAVLRGSKAHVYIHQTPAPIGAPLRFALAAAYGIPVIAEKMENAFPLRPGKDYYEIQYSSAVNQVLTALDGLHLQDLGKELHTRLCVEFSFRKCVEKGVEDSLARGDIDI